MSKLDSLLAQYETSSGAETPESPSSTPAQPSKPANKLDELLSSYGVAGPDSTEAAPKIYTPNPFISTAKSTAASMANAFAGQPLEDIGEAIGSETLQKTGRGVREFAEKVQQENPSQIGTLSDIVEKPLTAVETALGNVAPQIPVSLAGGYAGAKLGGSLPLPLPAKAVAAGVGGILGAFAPNYLQEAAEMRGKQHESGVEDKSKAYLTAIPAAGLETASDVLLAGKFLPKAVKESAVGKALGSIGEDALSETGSRAAHIGKQALKGAGTEAGTEYAQTALEQLGGNQDLSTEEAKAEREVSAALGAIGGGAIRGGVSAFDNRAAGVPIEEGTEPQPATSELDLRTDEEKAQQPIDLSTPVDTDFGEVPQPTGEPAIPVPAGGFSPESQGEKISQLDAESEEAVKNAKFDRLNDFINKYEARFAEGGIPTIVGRGLREASIAAGTYDPADKPDIVFEKLKAAVEAIKPPELRIEEAGKAAADASNATILEQTGGNPGAVARAAIAANTSGITTDVQNAKAAKEAEIVTEQSVTPSVEEIPLDQIDPETGEIRSNLDSQPDDTLKRIWLETGRTPEEKDQARQILESRRAAAAQQPKTQEATDALENEEASEANGGGISLAGTGEGNGDTTIGGEGVSPEGQADRNIPGAEQITTTEQQEILENGKSEDQTAQTTAQEVTPEIDRAKKMLLSVAPSGELNNLTGKHNVENRVKLIEAVTGVKPAKNKATIGRLKQVFYDAAGVSTDQTLRGQEQQFAAWATGQEVPNIPLSDGERRTHAALRKHIDDMAFEERGEALNELRQQHDLMKSRLYTSPVAKIPNRLAFEDSPKKPFVASLDVDSLKWINDNMGHQFGDALIERVGGALQGLDAYHVSGDEFVVQGESEEEIAKALQAAQEALKNAEIEAELPDGTVITTKGIGFSFGIGQDIANAETRLHQQKQQREEQGLRAERGGTPPGVAIAPPSRNEAASEVAPAPVDEVAAQVEANKEQVSDQQEQNGEYEKPEIEIAGIPIELENAGISAFTPAGSTRRGVGANGEEWETTLVDHYGEVKGTKGADGDPVDVFVVPGTTDFKTAFIVDQMKVGPDGKQLKEFDEHKVILGAKNRVEAEEIYKRNYAPDWDGMGHISYLGKEGFKKWLANPEAQKSPSGTTQRLIAKGAAAEAKEQGIDKGPFDPDLMLYLAGQLTVGGDIQPIIDDRGKVIGRTASINPEWFKTFPIRASVAGIKKAVDDFVAGKPIGKAQGKILRALTDVHDNERADAREEFQNRLDSLLSWAKEKLPVEEYEAWGRSADNGYITPDNIEESWKDLRDEIEAVAKNAAEKESDEPYIPFSRRAPASQTDLFATAKEEMDALRTKQGVADYAAQKDKRRQGNGSEPPPLFSDYPGFMGQTDIEDKEQSLSDLFKAMGKFDKAPATINHPDAERIRYVQDNFLDLLSELETNNKVEIKC